MGVRHWYCGKNGGARLAFLFAGDGMPAFLLTVFAKNERANLTRQEQAALVALAKDIAEGYRRRR